MMPIFYINVAASLARRRNMEGRLAALGLASERIDAVTPEDLPEAYIARYCTPGRFSLQWVNVKELACTLSHRKAWQLVADRNLPAALILEDDAILSSNLHAALSPLQLDGIDVVHIETRQLPVMIESGTGLRRIFSYHPGAAGYVVTRAGARKLLESRGFSFPVDDLIFDPRGPMFDRLQIRQLVPATCIPAEVAGMENLSDIGDRRGRTSEMDRRRQLPHALARRLFLRVREEMRVRVAKMALAVDYKVVPFER
jgi:glycosyl transferase family 25